MSTKFKCSVEIESQKYELVINCNELDIKFNEIYPKVRQIVKIALKEDIAFITHIFEIFESLSKSGSVVKSVDQLIKSDSRIVITNKEELNNPMTCVATALTLPKWTTLQVSTDSALIREEEYLLMSCDQIIVYYQIVLSVNIGWNLRDVYLWDKVYHQMDVWLSPNFDKNNFFCKNIFYYWTQYYAENFSKLNGKLSTKCQPIFDLLNIVHTLDLEKLFQKDNQILNEIKNIWKRLDFSEYYQKYLKDIQIEKQLTIEREESVGQTNSNLSSNTIPHSFLWRARIDRALSIANNSEHPFVRLLSFEEKILIKDKHMIETYSAIIKSINIGWDFKNGAHNWHKVCRLLDRRVDSNQLETYRNNFHYWTDFYAQNYNKLNGNIDLISQKIFDLLKIVHILDLNQFYLEGDWVNQQIHTISKNQELRNYFYTHLKGLWLKKVETAVKQRPVESLLIRSSTSQTSRSSDSSQYKSSESIRSVDRSLHQNRKKSRNYDNKEQRKSIRETFKDRSALKREEFLISNENNIKDYHRIVLAINIKWDYFKDKQFWDKVSQTINQKPLTADNCFDLFFFWAKYYTQNYEEIDSKLEPTSQKIFDLLKVVHTLDLHRIFLSSNEIVVKIREISKTYIFRSYFSKHLSRIRDKKVESKDEKSVVSDNGITQIHRMTYKTLLEFSKLNINGNNDQKNKTHPNAEEMSHNSLKSFYNKSTEITDRSDKAFDSWVKRSPDRHKDYYHYKRHHSKHR